jgi:mono/diheme cytochrome c family protein
LRHAAGLTRLNKLGSWKEVFLTLGIACVGIQLLTSSLLSQEVRRPNERLMNAELLQRGQRVYMDHCAGCHGKDGDGQGPGAYGLNPKPRDLTSAIFKLRSTPAGTLPTDEDMIRTVKQGVAGTSMNAFDLMPDQDVLAVVQYIKTFSTDWLETDRYEDPIYIPPTPAWFRDPEQRSEHAENGRDPFIGNCSTCHGEEGRGDGISATALMDAWEQPARPANLIAGKIKSGRTASDLYKAIATGLDGSPMPSFHGAIEDDELWDIVAYLVQLREDHRNQKTFQP